MKGIAHFLAGIAAASFVPDVVADAAQGSYLLVLGGLFGLLPDTLDFKFTRYFEQAEAIDPDPANLDPQALADQIAAAIDRAAAEHREIRVQLHTIKLGPDRWRQYTARFDAAHHEVAVKIGPIVNTSQAVLDARGATGFARARVQAGLQYTYDGDMNVDIFSGPSFAFVPKAGAVEIQFLPWHRAWSHSLTLAAALGAVMAALFQSGTVGLVTALSMAAHIAEDQLGYLGSNLFWPFTKERSHGAKLIHSGDAIPNFLAVWTALQVIFFNLDRFSAPQQLRPPMLEPWSFFGLAVLLPNAVLLTIYAAGKRRRRQPPAAARQADLVAEADELQLS